MRGRRDDEPHHRGAAARNGSASPPRRRAGAQAVAVRPGAPAHHDGPDGHGRNPGARRSTRHQQFRRPRPLQPRTVALAAAGFVILVLVVFGVTRLFGVSSGASSPAAASPPDAVATPLAAGPTVVPSQGPVQTSISPVEPSYTVQAGDTLATIARRFNTSVEALQSINNLPDRNALRVGQRLVIP